MSSIVDDPVAGLDPAAEVEAYGYSQQLRRTLRSFTSFAIAFSFISVTTGIFTTYSFVLTSSGPLGIWWWIPASVGMLCIALVYGQLAAHIPLSGYSYQWASRLSNPIVGWIFGWLAYCFLGVIFLSVDYALTTQVLTPLLHLSTSLATAEWVTIGIVLAQGLLIVFSTRIVELLNAAAVGTEIVGLLALTIALIVAVVVNSKGSLSNLTSTGIVSHAGYYKFNGPFMLAVLLGAYTLVGFESAANLAEETDNPKVVVPRAMWRALLISVVVGFVFLLALTVAIPNVTAITQSTAPVSEIMKSQLGSTVESIFLVFVTISMFACALIVMTSGSRLVHAMSRDQRFPGYQLFSKVSPALNTPMWATVLITAGGVLIMLTLGQTPATLNNLLATGTIVSMLAFAGTVVLFAFSQAQLPRRHVGFELGRWRIPITIGALIWLAVALEVLVVPSIFWTPVKVVFILLGIGAVVFAGFWVFARGVFKPELGTEVPAAPFQSSSGEALSAAREGTN